jgi:phage shock protein A
MSVLKRVTTIFQAKANKFLDKHEDPRETLDLQYEQMLEKLQQLKRGLADVATAKKRIEIQAQQLQQSANKLQDQAKQALSQNREDLAREALARRQAIAQQLSDLEAQHKQLEEQEQNMIILSQRTQAQVESFRAKKETIKATYTAAEAQSKVTEAVTGISEDMGDIGMALERAQDKVAQMQARAAGLNDLVASGALQDITSSSSDPLQMELDKASTSSQVESELAALKAQLGQSAPSGELSAPSETATEQEAKNES